MPTRSATAYQKCASTSAPDTEYILSAKVPKLSSYCVVVTRTAKGATLGERSKLRLHGGRESNE